MSASFRHLVAPPLLSAAILLAQSWAPTIAQDKPAVAASIPGGDIFGFTAGSGVGDVGEHGASFEFDGASGKRGGSYALFSQKYAYERVIAPSTTFGMALFTAYHRVRDVPVEPLNSSAFQFDGASVELAYRLIESDGGNPFGFKLAVEPRWARLTGGGRHTEAFGAELKFITDAVVVPERLFWAANLVLDAGTEREVEVSRYVAGSGAKLSSAITYQIQPTFFVGLEATYLQAFDGLFGRTAGSALFLGPTLYFKISEKAALNLTIAPQLAGKAKGVSGTLDLDNYERAITRVKLSMDF